jgi:predicted dehydrogenase
MNTTRLALVGLGDIGLGAHLPALLRHDSVKVVALVDTSAERRAAAARDGLDVVDDLDDALALGLDGVVLATPPWATPELTVRCAKEGLFVLAEKPVAVSVEAAAAYDVLSQAEQARVQIGLTYRHDPAVQRLGQWIADGTLGAPLLVRAHIYDERRGGDEAHTQRITATLAHPRRGARVRLAEPPARWAAGAGGGRLVARHQAGPAESQPGRCAAAVSERPCRPGGVRLVDGCAAPL